MTFVLGIVVVLFAWSVALALLAVSFRLVRAHARATRVRVETAWRDPIDALVLEGAPLPPAGPRERPVVLELLLRYRALLRGPEAARITDYLEEQGYVREAVDRLRSRSRWRRAEAAVELGRMRSDAAVAALVGLMGDESEDVRMVAARSLAAIGDPAAVEALTGALGDPSRWTATTVAADLVQLGPPAVPTLITIAREAEEGGPGTHDAAVTAVRVLGEIRDHRAAPVLAGLLERAPDLNVRARAASALGAVGGPSAPPALQAALHDEAWQVRAQAATSLGLLGARDSVAALREAVADNDWWVRRNCAEALGALGDEGRRALVELTGSPDRYVRDRCAAVLQARELEERR